MHDDEYTIFSTDSRIGDIDIDEVEIEARRAARMAVERAQREMERATRDKDFLKRIEHMKFSELLDALFDMPLMDEQCNDEDEWQFGILKHELYRRVEEGEV